MCNSLSKSLRRKKWVVLKREDTKEFVKCKSGDLELDAWIIKPANFDPTKKYPVIDYVYGEPASATVQNRWERSLFWHYLASLGYVVVSIENRGAAAPRPSEDQRGDRRSDAHFRGLLHRIRHGCL